MDLLTLRGILEKCWDVDTCYPPMREDYADNRVSYGQCYCTALVVNDFFGGSFCEVFFPEGGGHYWNRIDGEHVDLTRDQFDDGQFFPPPRILEREDLSETPEYLLLRKRVLDLL